MGDRPKDWVKWVPSAKWWYTCTHYSSKATPFEALYGYKPPILQSYALSTSKVEEVDSMLKDRAEIMHTPRNNLHRA